MAVTYYLDSAASDLTGGADWSVALQRTRPAAGSLSTSVKAGATDTEYAWTPSGDPGTNGSSTGTFTVTVNVTTASANINLAVSVARVNSAGTVQAGDISLGASQSLGTTGTKTFSISNPALGTWNAGDRLRIAYAFTSTSAHGTDTCAIATGDPNATVATPFVLVTNWTENPPADDAGLGDSASLGQQHGFIDDAGLGDSYSTAAAYSLTQTDSTGLTDAISLGHDAQITQTDSTGLTDSGILDGLDGVVYDDLTVSDTVTTQISQGQFYTPTFTDSAGLTDAATAPVTHVQNITDSVGSTDSVLAAAAHQITATDSAGQVDSTGLGQVKTAADSLSLSDAATATANHPVSASDDMGLSDSTALDRSTAQADNLSLSDAATVATDHPVGVSDSAGLSDSATVGATRPVVATDTLAGSDTASLAQQKTVQESIGLTDTVSQERGLVITDGAGLADSTSLDQAKVLADALGLSDSVVIDQAKVLADDAGLSDSVARTGSGGAFFSDPVSLSDTEVFDQAKVTTDALGCTDSALVTLGRNVAQTDVQGLSDDVRVDQAKVLTDSAALADQATLSEAEFEPVSDTAGLADTVAYGQAKVTTDSTGTVDSTRLAVGRGRPFTDTQGLSDTVAISQGKVLRDTVGLQDQASLVEAEARQAADDLALSDAVALDLQMGVGDDLDLDDSSMVFDREISFDDDSGPDEVWIFVQEKQVDDALELADAYLIEHSQALDDVGLSDTVVIEADFRLTMVDGVGLSDLATPYLAKGEVVLSGMYQSWDGYPVFGTIRLIPSKPQYVRAGAVRALTDLALEVEHGRVSLTVPVGDWTWTVVQQVAGTVHTSVIQPKDDLALSSLFYAGIPNGTAVPVTIVDMGDWQSEWAWDTPGWTSQQAFPDLSQQNTDNPPLVLPSVNVTGTFEDAYGKGAGGTVFAEPSVRVITYQDKVFTLPVLREEMQNGTVNFKIPVGNWDWKFTIRVGPTTDVYTVTAPSTDIDLATLVV